MNLAKKFNHDFKNGAFKLFDSNGNEIYHENIIGFWSKSEYDSNGREIFYKNINGYWYKKEFDSNGNEIYFESSRDGVIFDKRPTTSCNGKILEIDGKKYQLKEI